MRPVILSFWISLDGYIWDEGTELSQLMEAIEDPDHQEYFVALVARRRHAHHGPDDLPGDG